MEAASGYMVIGQKGRRAARKENGKNAKEYQVIRPFAWRRRAQRAVVGSPEEGEEEDRRPEEHAGDEV
jgi:hypothetical protein